MTRKNQLLQTTVISYNIRYHRAYSEMRNLVKTHRPDILCLQECFSDELTDKIHNLHLAAATTVGRLGMAMYTSAQYEVLKMHEVPLPLSLFERGFRKERTRLLVAELVHKSTGQLLNVGSFHATELVAPNALRHRQVEVALTYMRGLNETSPAILIGDYNYPFPKKRLQKIITGAGFTLAVSEDSTYRRHLFQGVFDFASVRNLRHERPQVLPFSASDHAPIMLTCAMQTPDLL